MKNLFKQIISSEKTETIPPEVIAHSREGRALEAYRFGNGKFKISLIAGCHSDEPVGPKFLRHLVSYLAKEKSGSELLNKYSWWIIPHCNPDGEAINQRWYSDNQQSYNLFEYLKHAFRELPGEDVEFCFPRNMDDKLARPENLGIYKWWHRESSPFSLHASLHGMSFASGPWFLIEQAWSNNSKLIQNQLTKEVLEKGYSLHDWDRKGEKGFQYIAPGFSTRPDSRAMQKFFLAKDDRKTAEKFRPNSMETIRSHGGNPLTLVSEMPLFLYPASEKEKQAREELKKFKNMLAEGKKEEDILKQASSLRVRAMPIIDQMYFQWCFITAGIKQVEKENGL